MKQIVINGQQVNYVVIYKNIKHLYVRQKSDHLLVTCAPRFSALTIEKFLTDNYHRIQKKTIKNQVSTNKYQLAGVVLSATDFYAKYQLTNNERNYLKVLRCNLQERTNNLAHTINLTIAKLGIKPVKIVFRKLKSRYGVCHYTKGYIVISLFMARLDDSYLQYLLLHEYAHFIEGNHSKKFYALLDQMMPNHQTILKQLRQHPISY